MSNVYDVATFAFSSRSASTAASAFFSSDAVTFLTESVDPAGNAPSSALTVILIPSMVLLSSKATGASSDSSASSASFSDSSVSFSSALASSVVASSGSEISSSDSIASC